MHGHGGGGCFTRLPAYRADLGRAVLLGAELLAAADILGTAAASPPSRTWVRWGWWFSSEPS
ncbi:DUF1622 domain-containing protein [Roseomonas chloroacetimidivorans]|uniref:DUF1622 domain-containing protein n=1 Tax=Roseomonas chloroacetimidivorans TaxID=1766656 RepID=UPI003C7892B4